MNENVEKSRISRWLGKKLLMRGAQNKFQQHGFTLLELLIVLILIGLVTALVTPRLGGSLSSVQVKTTVNKLSAMLRYARNITVTDQKTRVVSFDRATNRIVLELAKSPDNADDLAGNQEPEKSYERKVFQLPEGINIEKTLDYRGELEDDKKFKLYFYAAGNSSGGEIVLKGKRKSLYHVRVNFITGLVDASD